MLHPLLSNMARITILGAGYVLVLAFDHPLGFLRNMPSNC